MRSLALVPSLVSRSLVVAGALLLTLPTQSQTSPTTWSIQCRWGTGSWIPCANNDQFLYAEAAEFHANQLSAATRWLRDLGFAPPEIRDADADFLHAFIQDRGSVVDPGLLARYRDRTIRFNANELIYPGWPYGPANPDSDPGTAVNHLGTPVHELFHAVQAGELTIPGYNKAIADPRRWINEATAEAVMSVWLTQNPPLPEQTASYAAHNYDESLHGAQVSYEAWAFWWSLGRELGADDNIGYLRDLYDPAAVTSLTDEDSGVDWVHKALQGYHGDGLYYYYPQVIARHMNDETDYGSVQPVALNRTERITLNGLVDPLAAEAFRLEIDAPGNTPAQLTVEIDGPQRDNPALHLIVGEQRYDNFDGHEYNTFTRSIDPNQGRQTFLVRVANISETPSQSAPVSYPLRITLVAGAACGDESTLATVPEHGYRGSVSSAVAAQRALASMDSAYAQRVAGINDYTTVKTTSLTRLPVVVYHEKVPEADKPVFRMVLPDELANREAVNNGQPTPGQMMEGMAEAVGVLGRMLPGALDEVDVPEGLPIDETKLDVLARILPGQISGALRDMASGSPIDTRADAIDQLADMQLFADRSRLVGEVMVDGRRALLLEADDVADVDLDQPEDGTQYTLQKASLWLDAEKFVVLGLRFDVQGRNEAGTWPVLIESRNRDYRQAGPLYEPFVVHQCLAGLFGPESRAREVVTETAQILVNEGPPSPQRSAELIRDNQ